MQNQQALKGVFQRQRQSRASVSAASLRGGQAPQRGPPPQETAVLPDGSPPRWDSLLLEICGTPPALVDARGFLRVWAAALQESGRGWTAEEDAETDVLQLLDVVFGPALFNTGLPGTSVRPRCDVFWSHRHSLAGLPRRLAGCDKELVDQLLPPRAGTLPKVVQKTLWAQIAGKSKKVRLTADTAVAAATYCAATATQLKHAVVPQPELQDAFRAVLLEGPDSPVELEEAKFMESFGFVYRRGADAAALAAMLRAARAGGTGAAKDFLAAREQEEQRRRDDAAAKIQALKRGSVARQEAKRLRAAQQAEQEAENLRREDAAVTIQAAERGRQGRAAAGQLREERREVEEARRWLENEAATKLQAIHRGSQARLQAAEVRKAQRALEEQKKQAEAARQPAGGAGRTDGRAARRAPPGGQSAAAGDSDEEAALSAQRADDGAARKLAARKAIQERRAPAAAAPPRNTSPMAGRRPPAKAGGAQAALGGADAAEGAKYLWDSAVAATGAALHVVEAIAEGAAAELRAQAPFGFGGDDATAGGSQDELMDGAVVADELPEGTSEVPPSPYGHWSSSSPPQLLNRADSLDSLDEADDIGFRRGFAASLPRSAQQRSRRHPATAEPAGVAAGDWASDPHGLRSAVPLDRGLLRLLEGPRLPPAAAAAATASAPPSTARTPALGAPVLAWRGQREEVLEQEGAAEAGDPFKRLLHVQGLPHLHWIAEEMRATPLPPGVRRLDPRAPELQGAFVRGRCPCGPPPAVFARVAGPGQPLELSCEHPYQEAFEHAVALALLVERCSQQRAVLDAAEETWTEQYGKQIAAWTEGPVGGFVNAATGERSSVDPRQHLWRELQLGCKLIAGLRQRSAAAALLARPGEHWLATHLRAAQAAGAHTPPPLSQTGWPARRGSGSSACGDPLVLAAGVARPGQARRFGVPRASATE